MWYILYIRNRFNENIQKAVYVKNEWDLMAVIGYIYSSSTVGIEDIWYSRIKQHTEINKKTNELNIFYPYPEYGAYFENGIRKLKIYDYLIEKIKMGGGN